MVVLQGYGVVRHLLAVRLCAPRMDIHFPGYFPWTVAHRAGHHGSTTMASDSACSEAGLV